jgi:hypothetical protein
LFDALMKISLIFVELGLMGALAVLTVPKCMAVRNDTGTNNPFADIWEQNVFKLRAQPTNPPPEAAPKQPTDIKLTGFEKHGDEGTRVLMAKVPKDPTAPMKYYNLGVGEMQNGVEVVKIHPDQQAVDVLIDGEPEELTVKSNSFLTTILPKTATSSPQGAMPDLRSRERR